MRRLFMVFCLVCLPSSVLAADLPTYDIKAYCKQVAAMSGGSSMLELGCRDMENESKSNLTGMTVPAQTMSYCAGVAKISGGSYALLEGCIQMELEAAQKLQ